MRCPYCERAIDQAYVEEHSQTALETWLRKGDVIEGFCGGSFGRDSYGPRTVTNVDASGVEALDHNIGPTLEGVLVDSRWGDKESFKEHIEGIVTCADSILRNGVNIRHDLAEQLGIEVMPSEYERLEEQEEAMELAARVAEMPAPVVVRTPDGQPLKEGDVVPPRVGPATPLEGILIHTRGVLTPEGAWCQVAFAKDKDDKPVSAVSKKAVSWSLEGALIRVTGGPRYEEVRSLLLPVLGTERTEEWNDAEGRTQEEVLATLDGVIAGMIGKAPV